MIHFIQSFSRVKSWILLTWWCCQFSSGSSWELDDFASAFWPIWSWCEMSCVQTVISNKNLVRNTKDEVDFKRFYTTYHFSCLYKKNVSRKRMLQLNVYFYHRVIGPEQNKSSQKSSLFMEFLTHFEPLSQD